MTLKVKVNFTAKVIVKKLESFPTTFILIILLCDASFSSYSIGQDFLNTLYNIVYVSSFDGLVIQKSLFIKVLLCNLKNSIYSYRKGIPDVPLQYELISDLL